MFFISLLWTLNADTRYFLICCRLLFPLEYLVYFVAFIAGLFSAVVDYGCWGRVLHDLFCHLRTTTLLELGNSAYLVGLWTTTWIGNMGFMSIARIAEDGSPPVASTRSVGRLPYSTAAWIGSSMFTFLEFASACQCESCTSRTRDRSSRWDGSDVRQRTQHSTQSAYTTAPSQSPSKNIWSKLRQRMPRRETCDTLTWTCACRCKPPSYQRLGPFNWGFCRRGRRHCDCLSGVVQPMSSIPPVALS